MVHVHADMWHNNVIRTEGFNNLLIIYCLISCMFTIKLSDLLTVKLPCLESFHVIN